MRILFVIDSMASGGAQRLLVNLVQELSALDLDVSVFLYNPGEKYFLPELAKLPISVISAKRRRNGFSLSVLFKLVSLRPSKFDAVFAFQPTATIYCALLRFFRISINLIGCEFTIDNVHSSRLRRRMADAASAYCSAIVCNSHTQRKNLAERLGPHKTITTIWNGYNVEAFDYSERKLIGLNCICVIGRVSYAKNGVNFVKALILYFSRNGCLPKVNWIGRRDFDGPAVEMFNQMNHLIAGHKELNAQWSWLGEVEDIESIYKSSDCIILPSLFEGLPNVICEAMLFGCPILASDVSDNSILLGDGDRGLLFDPTSPEEICESLEKFKTMKHFQRSNMTKSARSFAEKELHQHKMAKDYLAIANQVSRTGA